jgi:signal transduction histidine kinase/CheY-like chemotaxis protein
MLKIQRWFLPSTIKQLNRDEQLKAKFLAVNTTSTLIWGPVMVSLVYWLNAPKTAAIIFYGLVVSMSSAFLLKYTAKVRLASQVFVWGLYLMLVALSLVNYGTMFGGLFWIVILPLLALNSINVRHGLAVLAACLALVTLLKIAETFGVKFPTEMTQETHQVLNYLSLLALTPLLFAIAAAYEGLSRSALLKERELNDTKTKFISNVSHELRTPLNGIIGMVGVIRNQTPHDKVDEYIESIDYSSNQLLTIVNDILQITEAESNQLKLKRETFKLAREVEQVIMGLRTIAQQKSIKLECELDANLPTTVSGDRKRLVQLLLNFIGNAIKFTEEGSVSLQVFGSKHQTGQHELTFKVIDTGIGISKENQNKLFTAFYQVDDSSTRKFQGTGLGLSICRQIIGLLGGSVTVESELGKGSCFTFSILVEEMRENIERDRKPSLPSELQVQGDYLLNQQGMVFQAKILVVEDNQVNQLVLQKLLEKDHHKITLANDGEEAIRLLKESSYDLILMDGHMPVLDGYKATQQIKQELMIQTPVIGVTAGVTADDMKKCENAGMDRVLAKPINKQELYKLLKEFLVSN